MKRDFPIMPAVVEQAERFFEQERSRVERAYFTDLAKRLRGPQPKAKRASYESRVMDRLAQKRKEKA